jgi:two-component system chemotaxis sensor kinase CheA
MTIDLNKHRDAFFSEAKTLVKTMNNALMELEKNPDQVNLLHEVYRAAHTLKSISGAMNYQKTMDLCHAMEDLLEAVRNKTIELKLCANLLFQCFDFLSENIKNLEVNGAELDPDDLIERLKKLLITDLKSVNENDQLDLPMTGIAVEKIKAIDVKVERLDLLMNLAEELLVSKMKFDVIREGMDNPELATSVEALGRLITELQYQVMQIRMVPIEFIFSRFHRMARDLAKQQKKEINFEIVGGDIELDRLLIDEIGESIAHLVKNAIDHGLETPAERRKLHKPAEGTIRLCATRSKEVVVIEISDDGAGLNLQSIKKTAIKRDILNHDANDEEVVDAIFSGISTKEVITEISGRGLGLGIVKQKIESIGGSVQVKSTPGQGTHFFIEIPLSLAIIKSLFVTVGAEIYAIPIDAVERLLIVTPDDFKGLLNYEAIIFDGNNIPVMRLSELFNTKVSELQRQPVVLIHKGGNRIGLVVDGLLSTQEIVIKPLCRPIKNNKYFSGAALIGSGQIVLILDIPYLFKSRKKSPSHVS